MMSLFAGVFGAGASNANPLFSERNAFRDKSSRPASESAAVAKLDEVHAEDKNKKKRKAKASAAEPEIEKKADKKARGKGKAEEAKPAKQAKAAAAAAAAAAAKQDPDRPRKKPRAEAPAAEAPAKPDASGIEPQEAATAAAAAGPVVSLVKAKGLRPGKDAKAREARAAELLQLQRTVFVGNLPTPACRKALAKLFAQ
jgi:hypothetical protein